jgi:hypothetical protein
LAAFAARGAQWDNIQQAAKNPKIKVELDKLLNPSARWWIDHRNTTIFGIDRIDVPPVTETPAPVVPPVTEACKQEEIAAAKKQADAEREAKIGISPLRAWIDKNHPNAKWNSRVYGSAKYGYSVYLDSRSASIPTQIWAEYEKWLKRKNEINAETVPVAPASAPVAPVAETVPVASAPMPVYDRPMTMPMIRSINDVRRSVCLQAWTLIRQGADKSSAFKAAWKTIKTL